VVLREKLIHGPGREKGGEGGKRNVKVIKRLGRTRCYEHQGHPGQSLNRTSPPAKKGIEKKKRRRERKKGGRGGAFVGRCWLVFPKGTIWIGN